MNYELAQKLKEAGFPKDNFIIHYPNKKYPKREGQSGTPTLSELIEACSHSFFALFEGVGNWVAYVGYMENGSYEKMGKGKTPEEAVANLWLELNKK